MVYNVFSWKTSLKQKNTSSSQGSERSESEDQDDEITSPPKRPSLSLFQFSTPCEKTWIAVAIILAILSGIMPCVITVLYGEFCNLMIDRQFPTDAPSTQTLVLAWFGGGRILQNASKRERQEALKEDSKAWGIGCAVFTLIQFLFSILSVFLLCYMAYRQVSRIKVILFKSVLCKDLAWFETRMIGNFAVQTSDDLNKLEAATGAVLGIVTCILMTITTGVVISFLYGWKLTLVIVFSIPLLIGTSSALAKVNREEKAFSCWSKSNVCFGGFIWVCRLRKKLFISCFLFMFPFISCAFPTAVPFGNLFLAEKSVADVVSIFTFQLTIGLINILISFLAGWRLSLVLMVFIIPMVISGFLKAKFQTRYVAEEMKLYSKAGSVAEEVFTSIRTVVAFGGENKEIERYSNLIKESKKYGVKRGLITGISNAISWFVIYASYSVAFFYGVRLLKFADKDDSFDFTPGDLLIVLFGILTALTNVGFATTHLETLSVARAAVLSVFEIINTKSKINPCSEDGDPGADCKGEIEFRNVHFEYPSRKGVRILNGVNLKIKAGEVVAIVGGSGAGKSTILQLIQRLYDPSKGEVLLDGRDIKFLKVSWLRQQLGVVGQEPLLFSTTIRDNILYGNMEASDEAVQQAATEANAHNFIQKLKDGYNTVIGQKGSTLSGGQKQRIAIARALIRDPKILLLDEATSALDATSEAAVQAALDRAAIGRTTLIVTHRLSTISKVDRIIVLADGVVSEEGTHQQLVAANGLYKELLQSQKDNLKGKEKSSVKVTVPTPRVVYEDVYEDPTFLPPGPRSRISSVASSRGPKGQVIESRNQFENATCYDFVKWSNPEWFYVSVGFLASLIGGAALPAVCVLFGDLFGLLSLTDFSEIISKTDFYALILIGVGMGAGICVFLQVYCFAIAGMRLTCRLRIKAFTRIIHQEIGYFDKEKNKVGALCVRLSKDPSEIQATVGIRLGVLIQSLATMGIGITLSFFFNWKMTLVATATLPLVFTGVYLESLFAESTETESGENATKIAVEVIANIKAVASLGKESFFVEKYSAALWKEKKKNIRKAWIRGFAFAVGQTAPFFCYALTLWYGGVLVADENVHYKYIIMISELLIFGAWTVGQSVAVGPSFGQTKIAMNRLQYIFNKKPKVKGGDSTFPPDLQKTGGIISYSGVDFFYPTRPGVQVLENLNMNIRPGQSVAVVGPSGSGKSTVIQLMQRFYDPTFGYISANDVDIKGYTLSSLRKELGLVSQEPVLFNRTIAENIAYGDNTREVPLADIITAAKSANIHSFIASLPLGYGTNVGGQGTHLSGGQKQRIAISRALVRNPQILLLDEATSALDPQSESIVQDALDKASSGRTTITVAHRLSAVRNADLIYVVESGKVKEYGTHEALMKLKGLYYDMHHQKSTQEDDDEIVEEVEENKPEISEK